MRANLKVLMKRAVAVVLAMVVAFAGVSALGSAGAARAAGSEEDVEAGEGGTTANPSEKSIAGIGTTAITSPREPESNEDPWIGNYG